MKYNAQQKDTQVIINKLNGYMATAVDILISDCENMCNLRTILGSKSTIQRV